LDALPVEEVRIDADAAAPEAVCRWWGRRHVFAFFVIAADHVVFQYGGHVCVAGFFVAPQVHADGDDGLETFAATCHVGHVGMGVVPRWIQHEHAEADEGVAEENRDGEEHHDEEDVDFLAEGAVGEGDG
jgi:hypothetical protein